MIDLSKGTRGYTSLIVNSKGSFKFDYRGQSSYLPSIPSKMSFLVGGPIINRNTLFPYNEAIERHFQLIESIENKIPLYPTRIWRTKPTELEYHFFREKEFQRQKKLNSVKRNFQPHFGLPIPLLQTNNKKTQQTEGQREREDERTHKKIVQSSVKEPELHELERYFNNTSPIPLLDHSPEEGDDSFEEEEDKDEEEEEDTLKGEATEEDIEEEEEDDDDDMDHEEDLLKKFNGNYRNALSSGTPAEKEIKKAEANRKKRLAYKKRTFQKKLNDGFIIYQNERRKSKSWNKGKTNHSNKNVDTKCPPLDFVNFPSIHMKL